MLKILLCMLTIVDMELAQYLEQKLKAIDGNVQNLGKRTKNASQSFTILHQLASSVCEE